MTYKISQIKKTKTDGVLVDAILLKLHIYDEADTRKSYVGDYNLTSAEVADVLAGDEDAKLLAIGERELAILIPSYEAENGALPDVEYKDPTTVTENNVLIYRDRDVKKLAYETAEATLTRATARKDNLSTIITNVTADANAGYEAYTPTEGEQMRIDTGDFEITQEYLDSKVTRAQGAYDNAVQAETDATTYREAKLSAYNTAQSAVDAL